MAKGAIAIPPLDHCFHKLGFSSLEEAQPYVRNANQQARLCSACGQYHITDIQPSATKGSENV